MAEDERFFSRQIYLVVEISEFRSAKYFKCFESFLFIPSPLLTVLGWSLTSTFLLSPLWSMDDTARGKEKAKKKKGLKEKHWGQ